MNWVVFDYGNVISRPTAALPTLAARIGAPETEFTAAYWAHRERYDAGAPDQWYWQSVSAAAGGRPVDAALCAELTELDVAGWLVTDPDSLALLAELDAAGVPLALLSNATSSFGRAAERQDWAGHFRHLMFSGDLGVIKPDAEIFAALTDRLAARPGECFFLDDRQINVDGAHAAGLHAARWTDARTAREQLAGFR